MHIVYWAHSYRDQDAAVNQHFGILIEEAARLIVNFDPPSQDLNAAKLEQNLRSCDGMVAVLTWRPAAPSPYILYEICMALRARKPVLVFLDDRLPDSTIPSNVLQRRFSHRTYFRQVRDHSHALNELKTYMGEQPGPRYQAGLGQRTCGTLGLRNLQRDRRETLGDLVETRGYRLLDLELMDLTNPLSFASFQYLNGLDVALHCVDSRTRRYSYWAGALNAAAVPAISFTQDAGYRFDDRFPREFQPRALGQGDEMELAELVQAEFDLFEQDFLKVQDPEAIVRYTRMQLEAGALAGRYEQETRKQFMEVVMGDKYTAYGPAGVVGPNAHDNTVHQVWNQLSGQLDLPRLASELQQLQTAMEREGSSAEQKMATGAVAAAEQSAKESDGPKTLEYLKTAGKWALSMAETIGLDLAKEALKGALGV